MRNGTVRLYRGNEYWILYGLPGKIGRLNGPHQIFLQSMAPVKESAVIVTILSGNEMDHVIKMEEQDLWIWRDDGSLKFKGKVTDYFGSSGSGLPSGYTFHEMFQIQCLLAFILPKYVQKHLCHNSINIPSQRCGTTMGRILLILMSMILKDKSEERMEKTFRKT